MKSQSSGFGCCKQLWDPLGAQRHLKTHMVSYTFSSKLLSIRFITPNQLWFHTFAVVNEALVCSSNL